MYCQARCHFPGHVGLDRLEQDQENYNECARLGLLVKTLFVSMGNAFENMFSIQFSNFYRVMSLKYNWEGLHV